MHTPPHTLYTHFLIYTHPHTLYTNISHKNAPTLTPTLHTTHSLIPPQTSPTHTHSHHNTHTHLYTHIHFRWKSCSLIGWLIQLHPGRQHLHINSLTHIFQVQPWTQATSHSLAHRITSTNWSLATSDSPPYIFKSNSLSPGNL